MALLEWAHEGWNKLKGIAHEEHGAYLEKHPRAIDETASRWEKILGQHEAVLRSGGALAFETDNPSQNNHTVMTVTPTHTKGADEKSPLGLTLSITGFGSERTQLQPTTASRDAGNSEWLHSLTFGLMGHMLHRGATDDEADGVLQTLHKEPLKVVVYGAAGSSVTDVPAEPATPESIAAETPEQVPEGEPIDHTKRTPSTESDLVGAGGGGLAKAPFVVPRADGTREPQTQA